MFTIHQVTEGWEVRQNGISVQLFPIKIFETHTCCLGILAAIEYVRKNGYGNATYYDFSQIISHK
jgi:hypothetical protein